MLPYAKAYLYEIGEAAQLLRHFTQDVTHEEFVQSVLLVAASERQLGIIGRAIGRLEKSDRDTVAHITDTSNSSLLREH